LGLKVGVEPEVQCFGFRVQGSWCHDGPFGVKGGFGCGVEGEFRCGVEGEVRV